MLQKKVQNNVYINGKYNFLISKLSLLVISRDLDDTFYFQITNLVLKYP